MECKSNKVIHSEDFEKPRIKEPFNEDEITESQTTSVQQFDTHFMKCDQSSDVDTKFGIKEENSDQNLTSSVVKSDPKQPLTWLCPTTIKDDEIDMKVHDNQDEVLHESQSFHLEQNNTYFVDHDATSDVNPKVQIKQEAWDPNGVSSDIKCDPEQPIQGTLKVNDEIDIKEELCWVEGTSAVLLNEQEGSCSKQNETAEDVPLLKSPRLHVEASKFNCLRGAFRKVVPYNGNNSSLTSNRVLKEHTTTKEDKSHKSDLSYTKLWHLKQHKVIREGKKLYKCDVCDKTFTELGILKRHKLIHADTKPHKCDVCNKCFTLSGTLKRHKFIHEDKRPHKCDVCDKGYIQPGTLKAHKLCHEGKKPYRCDVCDMSFTVLGSLKRHKMIHEGKRPHKCDVCGKSFAQLGNLKAHKLVHEGRKPHECDVCEMSFTQLGTLQRHKRIHKNIKPYNCGT